MGLVFGKSVRVWSRVNLRVRLGELFLGALLEKYRNAL
jgi:hypothetical protein